ncbi:hypothetical protein NIES4074_32100 [Cylindrospermum sp. NIES-4074]|nr:hypothetical protein NIES4074_32100 [Cylindrospermum sp. NIES-4074]
MLLKLQQLYKAVQMAKNSDKLGDFAILKADVLGAKADAGVATKLQQVVGYYPEIDLELLSKYPQGTFGREYAAHMQANNLKPLNISPELDDVARKLFSLLVFPSGQGDAPIDASEEMFENALKHYFGEIVSPRQMMLPPSHRLPFTADFLSIEPNTGLYHFTKSPIQIICF